MNKSKDKRKEITLKGKVALAFFLGKLEEFKYPDRSMRINGEMFCLYPETQIIKILQMKTEILKTL